ncbi:hypothetical protein SNEBB_009572 [Seison nebaliae]|nr:hypothetical protein SNEBB_009572 [Seison nebaliae]
MFSVDVFLNVRHMETLVKELKSTLIRNRFAILLNNRNPEDDHCITLIGEHLSQLTCDWLLNYMIVFCELTHDPSIDDITDQLSQSASVIYRFQQWTMRKLFLEKLKRKLRVGPSSCDDWLNEKNEHEILTASLVDKKVKRRRKKRKLSVGDKRSWRKRWKKFKMENESDLQENDSTRTESELEDEMRKDESQMIVSSTTVNDNEVITIEDHDDDKDDEDDEEEEEEEEDDDDDNDNDNKSIDSTTNSNISSNRSSTTHDDFYGINVEKTMENEENNLEGEIRERKLFEGSNVDDNLSGSNTDPFTSRMTLFDLFKRQLSIATSTGCESEHFQYRTSWKRLRVEVRELIGKMFHLIRSCALAMKSARDTTDSIYVMRLDNYISFLKLTDRRIVGETKFTRLLIRNPKKIEKKQKLDEEELNFFTFMFCDQLEQIVYISFIFLRYQMDDIPLIQHIDQLSHGTRINRFDDDFSPIIRNCQKEFREQYEKILSDCSSHLKSYRITKINDGQLCLFDMIVLFIFIQSFHRTDVEHVKRLMGQKSELDFRSQLIDEMAQMFRDRFSQSFDFILTKLSVLSVIRLQQIYQLMFRKKNLILTNENQTEIPFPFKFKY